MIFQYKAMNADGGVVKGKLQADNPEDLEIRLQRMDLDVISYTNKNKPSINGLSTAVQRRDLMTFCFYMEQLLRAGVPLLQGLEDLRDSMEQSRFKDVIASLIEDVQAGSFLSEAMAKYPKIFDTVFVNLVRVGEESGELSTIFSHLNESLKWEDELRSQTKKLLIYPSFAASTILMMVFFMMVFLVPQVKTFMLNMAGTLPPETQLLIAISDTVVAYWPLFMLAPIVFVASIVIAIKVSPPFHYYFDDFKLRLWVVGPIMKKLILARFAGFFALMYASGITVLDSLAVLQKTANNLAIEKAIMDASEQIAEGNSISGSFSDTGLFPPLVIRMLSVGENTGELDISLRNVSYFYDRDVKESIGKLQAMIEPVMILSLGLIMAWLIVAVLGPIYDVAIGSASNMNSGS
jgi:type IV pilus assembly protein PilC